MNSWPKEPICQCGDWKFEHIKGEGKCRICHDKPFENCIQFRYSHDEEMTIFAIQAKERSIAMEHKTLTK